MNIYLQINVIKVLRLLTLFLVFVASAVLGLDVCADWTKAGSINGVQIYRDNDTDLEWTVSLSRVSSFVTAKQKVNKLGFRVPTHREFQSLEHNGGIKQLGINTAWASGFYWEASDGLVNGNGGNFSIFPSTRARVGEPYAIGVRKKAATSPSPIPPAQGGNSSKVHMLFVWGTKATDTHDIVIISKIKMEKALATPRDRESDFGFKFGIGLGKNEPHVANYITLEGDNATAKNINDISCKLSQEAGPNDAVFVYILCHSATTYEDNDTTQQNLIHLLSPNCDDVNNMQPRELGIKRSAIWKNITSKPHRLNVLITDSCTPIYQERPSRIVIVDRVGSESESALYKVLMEGSGSLNINSTDPNGNFGTGEIAMGWAPIMADKTGDLLGEVAIECYDSGTTFTNAFINLAHKRIDVNDSYTVDKFYGELKEQLDKQFKSLLDYFDKKSDQKIKTFERQGTQTLTKFHDNGVAIKNEPKSKADR
jgi:hypothetical protein